MEPSTRTLAPITSTNEAKASMSTASSTASRTSDSPSKSPLWRLPPDVLTNLQPSYWTRRSSHGPPDGGPAGAVPPAGFVLEEFARNSHALQVDVVAIECRHAEDLAPACDRAERLGAQALISAADAILVANRKTIIDLARSKRLPTMY